MWKDSWLPNLHFGFVSSSMLPSLEDANVSSLILEGKKEWDTDVLSDMFCE